MANQLVIMKMNNRAYQAVTTIIATYRQATTGAADPLASVSIIIEDLYLHVK